MWAYTNNSVHSLSSRPGRRSGGFWASIPPGFRHALSQANPLHALRIWWRHEESVNELHGLDDRTLADLGITRGDFPAIVSGTFRRGE